MHSDLRPTSTIWLDPWRMICWIVIAIVEKNMVWMILYQIQLPYSGLSDLVWTFYTLCSPFLLQILYFFLICYVSHVKCHMSLIITATVKDPPILSPPLFTVGWSTEGWIKKPKKIENEKKKNGTKNYKSCVIAGKISDMRRSSQ